MQKSIIVKKPYQVTLEFPEAERVVFLHGINGCGKSTVLHTIDEEWGDEDYVEATGFESDTDAEPYTVSPGLPVPADWLRESQISAMLDLFNQHVTTKVQFSLYFNCFGTERCSDYRLPLSQGEFRALQVYTAALNVPPGGILLLDDPELHLHVRWQKRIVDDLLAINSSMYVICATHSPYVIGERRDGMVAMSEPEPKLKEYHEGTPTMLKQLDSDAPKAAGVSESSSCDLGWISKEPRGTTCSVCGGPQYDSSSGVTCDQGHGGAPSMEETQSEDGTWPGRQPERHQRFSVSVYMDGDRIQGDILPVPDVAFFETLREKLVSEFVGLKMSASAAAGIKAYVESAIEDALAEGTIELRNGRWHEQ